MVRSCSTQSISISEIDWPFKNGCSYREHQKALLIQELSAEMPCHECSLEIHLVHLEVLFHDIIVVNAGHIEASCNAHHRVEFR